MGNPYFSYGYAEVMAVAYMQKLWLWHSQSYAEDRSEGTLILSRCEHAKGSWMEKKTNESILKDHNVKERLSLFGISEFFNSLLHNLLAGIQFGKKKRWKDKDIEEGFNVMHRPNHESRW